MLYHLLLPVGENAHYGIPFLLDEIIPFCHGLPPSICECFTRARCVGPLPKIRIRGGFFRTIGHGIILVSIHTSHIRRANRASTQLAPPVYFTTRLPSLTLRQNPLDHAGGLDAGEAGIESLEAVGQAGVIETELV